MARLKLVSTKASGRVPHLRDGFIVAEVGLALRVTALLWLVSTLFAANAQSATCGISKLPPATTKIYPPIAKAAHVGGTVILLASFDHDGTSKVTKIISGPEMLKRSAVQFVELSKSDPSTGSRECPIVISFELAGTPTCEIPPDPETPFAMKDRQHVSVYGTTYMLCDPESTITRKKRFGIF